ncbi:MULTISPECIES: type II toxin-antitoxin system HipA family toxin [unclassified Roseateles]|uniref:type II toxin-antitoxin system HipA family toxin n=1 Tax=unclassified Roseateles TaxID=2626991 RepID=UPI001607DDE4|nr:MULTISPECIES: type II toxin-antitoxin system HipA family toxin [unclassified Roseateles]
MNKVDVEWRAWGESWTLGTLAERGWVTLFEYSSEALSRGVDFSPLHVPLRAQTYSGFPDHLGGVPGFIADALPDGWGLLLMDRVFRKAGRDPAQISTLDRLSFIADRAMGALAFKPASDLEITQEDMTLLQLAQAAHDVIEDRDTDALKTLALVGGSPQGARPKALIQYEVPTRRVSTDPAAAGDPWLVKFPAQNEHVEVCGIEVAYANLARAAGIDMPDTQLFKISPKLAAFGVERFDRCDGMRVPVQSLAALLHADFRLPSVDYQQLLQATRFATASHPEVLKAFRRCVFNVVFNNRDDHTKNFALRMNRRMAWELAPAFDLTFNTGPGGYHQMSVMGEAKSPSRDHLLKLARACDIAEGAAADTIDAICEAARGLDAALDREGVRRTTRKAIGVAVDANLRRCSAAG